MIRMKAKKTAFLGAIVAVFVIGIAVGVYFHRAPDGPCTRALKDDPSSVHISIGVHGTNLFDVVNHDLDANGTGAVIYDGRTYTISHDDMWKILDNFDRRVVAQKHSKFPEAINSVCSDSPTTKVSITCGKFHREASNSCGRDWGLSWPITSAAGIEDR